MRQTVITILLSLTTAAAAYAQTAYDALMFSETDTHCIRITGRLGLTKNKEPAKVEVDLVKLIPPEKSSHFCHQIVEFGRDICSARKPKCDECPLNYFCKYYCGKK